MNTHVLVYNTKLVKKDDVPKTFDEVTQPKWKGKITMPEDFDIFGMMLKVMGLSKGMEFMRRLAYFVRLTVCWRHHGRGRCN